MAQIIITIPDLQENRVLDAVTSRHGWTVGSGLTKRQFVKQFLIDTLKDDVKFVEAQTAREVHRAAGDTAGQLAIDKVEAEVVFT